ncbi:unannotated protein [freshwater metagenome]|uniref:Unannotated protein n=1 Tax=freshwater metagenome TaxID=449393 RepID=A0A6J7EV22_9ZZZZ
MLVAWANPLHGRLNAGTAGKGRNLPLLLGRCEGDNGAGLPCTRGAACTVQVVLRVVRRIDVDDERDAINVDSASGDVGSDERRRDAIAEGSEGAGADRLGLAAMERPGCDALGGQLVGQAVDAGLGAHEEDGAPLTCADLRRHLFLVARVDDEDVVIHGLDRGLSRRQRMASGILHIGLDERVDVAVERCAEQQSLAACPGLVEQFADDRHEAHVGHLVSLVQHRDRHLGEVDCTTIDEVLEPTRSRNEDVDAAVEGLDLLDIGHTANDQADAKAACVRERRKAIADLHCEFTGRHEDEPVGLLRRRTTTGKAGKHCKAECKGLARAGLRSRQNVSSRDCVRKGCDLDGERLIDAGATERPDQ